MMNTDTRMIWECYQNKLIIDRFDVMITRTNQYVNILLEKISPEDIQRMKDADATGDDRIRNKQMKELQRKYHQDRGGSHEDSADVNSWYQDHKIPYSDTQSEPQSQSSDGMSWEDFVKSQQNKDYSQYGRHTTYGDGSDDADSDADSSDDVDPDVTRAFNDIMNQWVEFKIDHHPEFLFSSQDAMRVAAKYTAQRNYNQYKTAIRDWFEKNKHNIPTAQDVYSRLLTPDQWMSIYLDEPNNIPHPGDIHTEPVEEPETQSTQQHDPSHDAELVRLMKDINTMLDDETIKGAANYKRGDFDPSVIKNDIEQLIKLSSKLTEILQFLTTGDSQSTGEQTTSGKYKISKINKLLQKIGKMFNKTDVSV